MWRNMPLPIVQDLIAWSLSIHPITNLLTFLIFLISYLNLLLILRLALEGKCFICVEEFAVLFIYLIIFILLFCPSRR